MWKEETDYWRKWQKARSEWLDARPRGGICRPRLQVVGDAVKRTIGFEIEADTMGCALHCRHIGMRKERCVCGKEIS